MFDIDDGNWFGSSWNFIILNFEGKWKLVLDSGVEIKVMDFSYIIEKLYFRKIDLSLCGFEFERYKCVNLWGVDCFLYFNICVGILG